MKNKDRNVSDEVRKILAASKVGLSSQQIINLINVEKYPHSSDALLKVLLHNLRAKGDIRTEKIECVGCACEKMFYFMTEQGRLALEWKELKKAQKEVDAACDKFNEEYLAKREGKNTNE